MNSTAIPAELLELKASFDQWRETRQHNREPIPDELRNAALEMGRRHPRALVRRVLKIDPGRLQEQAANSALKPNRKHARTAFYKLPTATTALPGSSAQSQSTSPYRLQIERPDGTRLTITIPAVDADRLHRLCADFLRGTEQ
jgi:hypothetical protein